MRKIMLAVVSVAVIAATPAVFAAPAGAAKGAAGQFYRYRNEQGVLVIDKSIPPELARRGYDIVTGAGQLINKVAPSEAVDVREVQRQKEQRADQARDDAKLRKLYSSIADAERLRDRQMDAVTLKIDFAKGQVQQAINKRRLEMEQAARVERKGGTVSQQTRDNIDRLNKQVAELEEKARILEQDRERIRAEFAPVLERLQVIYPGASAAPAMSTVPTSP